MALVVSRVEDEMEFLHEISCLVNYLKSAFELTAALEMFAAYDMSTLSEPQERRCVVSLSDFQTVAGYIAVDFAGCCLAN